MSVIKDAAQAVMKKAIEIAPDSIMPGGHPDPIINRKHGLIGAPISRIDGPLKVQGSARFAAEFPMDGLLYAALSYSTIARGRIATLDTSAAEAAEGVVLVMTHRNALRLKPTPLFMSAAKAAGGDDLPVMQDDLIHWNGQPIAIVLAESQEQADHAKSLIRATYDAEAGTTSFAAGKAAGLKVGNFQGEPLKHEIGDAEAALAAAPHKVDHIYRTPRHNHNAIELHAATVAWQGDELRIHDASQAVAHMAWSMAHIFGLDEKKVHVSSPYVGGGFGGKTLWSHHVLACAAAKLAGRPVRIMLSREGVYRVVGGRTNTEQRVAIGAQADGHFDALIHTGVVAMSAHNNVPEPFILPAQSAYAAGSFKLEVQVATLDMLANTFMRAPGESVGTFGLECAVDELAVELQMDPIELRVRNEPDKDPTTGLRFSSRNIIEAYRTGAERFGWNKRHLKPGMHREGEWLIGLGCATATYPYYRMPGGIARITISKEGRVKIEIAAHEMGMGTSTAQTQIAAERLGLPIGVHAGSNYHNPPSSVGWGSYHIEDYVAQAQAFQTQLTSLIVEGVFARHPKLKMVMLESGFTWLAPFVWRLHKFWRGIRMETPWVDRPPMEIVHSNIRFSLQPVDAPPDSATLHRLFDHMQSDELILFSTDYPHWQFEGDSALPEGISDDLVRKIMIDNPHATYPRLKQLAPV